VRRGSQRVLNTDRRHGRRRWSPVWITSPRVVDYGTCAGVMW